jgi:hypothetical protein
LSGERSKINEEIVVWGGADTVMGDIATNPENYAGRCRLGEQHICKKLVLNNSGEIDYALVEDLINWKTIKVHAKQYVLACGTILNAQLMFNSDIKLPHLGLYLDEQLLAFC